MALNDAEKLELLWKHFKGVAPTSPAKVAHNEAVISLSPIFQQNFWTDSDRIPVPAPLVPQPIGNELWFDVIEPHLQSFAVRLVPDMSTDGTAWHAMSKFSEGIIEANRLGNWVPPQFHRSYHISVWAGEPTTNFAVPLSPVEIGYEWEFDYTSGILYFPHEVPPIALQNGIWIEGYRYIGEIGREGQAVPHANASRIREYSRTFTMSADEVIDFDLPTGGKVILVEAKVTHPSILECHATSLRTDTNPYKFAAITSHLVDDGSYVIAGQRFYGERFVPLINMEDTSSDLTYWRITNTSGETRVITVIVKVA